jgi:thiol-disulfide isomerase/thioredoxin
MIIMRHIINYLILIIFSSSLFSQEYKIEGTISGAQERQVFLIGYDHGEQQIIDTTMTDQSGYFVFELPEDARPGMYDIFAGQDTFFEFVFNNENIRFITTGSTKNDKITFIDSEENKVYYDYIYTKADNIYKINLLNPLIRQYPKDDPFHGTLINQYLKLAGQIDSVVASNAKEHPGFLSVKYMKSDKPAIPPPGLTEKQETEWLKKHFLDNVDFSDTALINSSILSSKVVAYLQLFQSGSTTQQDAEDAMKPALDTLLEKATLNGKVYGWLMEYLVGGFETVGFDDLLIYLNDKEAADNICEDETRKEVMKKLQLAKNLAIGASAPEIKAKDLNGNPFDLDKLKADKTVLAFWASWCPHCIKEALPVLKKMYEENKGKFEVVAISVDDDIKDAKNAVTDHGYEWITIAEGKGWDGDIPLEYGISGTPTFFVLDKDKKIIAKPKNVESLKSILGL